MLGLVSVPNTSSDWNGPRGERWGEHLERMEQTLEPFDAPLVKALELDRSLRVADLACGGGGTTRAIARAAVPGSEVWGFDCSERLIHLAQQRSSGQERGYAVADLERSPLPAIPFDRLSSRFGTMFFDEPADAFRRLRGWLAPEGKLAFMVWGALEANPWLGLVRDVVERFVTLPDVEPEGPGPMRYAVEGSLEGLLREAGFRGVEGVSWSTRVRIGGGLEPQAAAHFALSSFGRFGPALEKAGRFGPASDALENRLRDFPEGLDARIRLVTAGAG